MSNTWFRLRRGFFLSFFPSDTPHYENVLPDGWCLTDIGELLINRDGERKPVSSVIRSKQTSKIYDYYGAAGVIDKVDSYLFDERLLLIGEDGANLLSRSKNNAFFAEGRYWVNNHAHVLDATDKNLLDFIAIVINSMKLDDYITGSAQPKLSQDNLNKIPIVLPPLAEQQRIIAEIKKWFTLIDQIEQGKADLQTTIELTKSKILDLAIHGKLIPQDPNDEPAIELLRRINPSFKSCDNAHYKSALQGWCSISLNDCMVEILNGFAFQSGKYVENGIRVIRITNVQDGKIMDDDPKFYPKSSIKEIEKFILKKNDLLMSLTGNVGRVGFLPNELLPAALNQRVGCIRMNEQFIHKKYLFYYFQTDTFRNDCITSAKGVAQLNISTEWLKRYLINIPPYAEQKRIVAKIEELFATIDKIKESLEA
mgnify:CR=1 FL=1